MKSLFVDANVIIDYLANREPFSTDAAMLFELAEQKKIRLHAASVSFNLVYYIVRQKFGHATTMEYLRDMAELLTPMDVTATVITQALASENPDFEDAIQYYTAISNPLTDAIITRDKKGYRKSKIPVLSPQEALARLSR